jgi:hypothetical protein
MSQAQQPSKPESKLPLFAVGERDKPKPRTGLRAGAQEVATK